MKRTRDDGGGKKTKKNEMRTDGVLSWKKRGKKDGGLQGIRRKKAKQIGNTKS